MQRVLMSKRNGQLVIGVPVSFLDIEKLHKVDTYYITYQKLDGYIVQFQNDVLWTYFGASMFEDLGEL